MSRQINKLNNIDHASLTVITEYAARWGDDCMSCLAYTTEMRQLQAVYPLLFQMTSEAPEPLPIALLGFTPGQSITAASQLIVSHIKSIINLVFKESIKLTDIKLSSSSRTLQAKTS